MSDELLKLADNYERWGLSEAKRLSTADLTTSAAITATASMFMIAQFLRAKATEADDGA